MPLDSNANIKDIITSLQELEGINAKADLASVVGSPATSDDNMATISNVILDGKKAIKDKVEEINKDIILPNNPTFNDLVNGIDSFGGWYREGDIIIDSNLLQISDGGEILNSINQSYVYNINIRDGYVYVISRNKVQKLDYEFNIIAEVTLEYVSIPVNNHFSSDGYLYIAQEGRIITKVDINMMEIVWTKTHSSPPNNVSSFILDSEDNIIIGYNGDLSVTDFQKFTKEGVLLWSSPKLMVSKCIVVCDYDDNIIACSVGNTSNQSTNTLIKYDSSGNEFWRRRRGDVGSILHVMTNSSKDRIFVYSSSPSPYIKEIDLDTGFPIWEVVYENSNTVTDIIFDDVYEEFYVASNSNKIYKWSALKRSSWESSIVTPQQIQQDGEYIFVTSLRTTSGEMGAAKLSKFAEYTII